MPRQAGPRPQGLADGEGSQVRKPNIIYYLEHYLPSIIHRIFLSLDWEDVEARRLSPPIVPKLTHAGDTRNFEEFSEPKWSKDDLSTEEMELFKLF